MKNLIFIFAIAIIIMATSCSTQVADSELSDYDKKLVAYDSLGEVFKKLEFETIKEKQAYDSARQAGASDSVLISMLGLRRIKIDSLVLVEVQCEILRAEILRAKH